MSNLQKQLQHETRDLRMSDAEKAAMRARLIAAMAPVRATPKKSPYQWMFYARTVSSFALVVLLIVSTGTAYAAEGALPGATLYPIKTNVIEPLKVALAKTPAAKAEANASIAATRVVEAQTLAAKGRLTPEVAKVISDNYNVHAEAALALAAHVDAETNTIDGGTEPAQDLSIGSGEPREGLTPASSTVGTDTKVAVAPQAKIMSFSTGLAVTATETATATATATSSAPRTSKEPMRKIHSSTVGSSTIYAADTRQATSTGSLVRKLRATLSTQAKILDELNAEVRVKGEAEHSSTEGDSRRGRK